MTHRSGLFITRRLRAGWLIALAAALVVGTTAVRTQDPKPQAQPPTFRSAVDLVPVDVNIVDNTGRPVTGLEPTDFSLQVDGKPRRVASAEFISASTTLTPLAPAPTHFGSNDSGGGRLIMLVVDQGNIGTGRGRLILESARKFVDALGPSDRVALVAIPGSGPQLDFTANHAVVSAMLPRLIGLAGPFISDRVGVSEAYRLNRGDGITVDVAMERECRGARTPQDLELCKNHLLAEAQSTYAISSERTQNALVSLRHLMERLALTNAPKTIIFISEGLIIDRDRDEITWLNQVATRGQISMYALQVDEPYFDASEMKISPTRREDLNLAEDGLGTMAGMARGTMMRTVGNGEQTFKRLALELSGYYLLSFEPEPGDRDGKMHKIKVQVPKRNGIEVRARSEFRVEAGAAKTEDSMLADALQSPLLLTDIRLKLSTYTLREPTTNKLRVLLATEIDRSLNSDGKLSLAYTLSDANGRLVATQLEKELKNPVNPTTKVQNYSGLVMTDNPGTHRVKLAVVDDRGRRGSVEYTFRAALTAFGQLRATDLLIADNQRAAGGSVAPVVGSEITSGVLHAYIELYSEAPELLNNATVNFEVAAGDEAKALDGAMGRPQPPTADAPQQRIVEASIPLALLPPGDYVVRAVISADGKRLGQVSRVLKVGRVVTPTRTTTTASGFKSSSSSRGTIPFNSRTERFDRGSVLTPQVVGFFIDRMNFGARGETNAAPAIEHARAGRFDEAASALSSGALPATFLSGLSLYAKGELEPAASKFRETLRLDSEFFPAAFYLGSCYAAGGRDQEAVGAWQMSLVTESDAPFIYTLLGDALLRLREVDHALEILNEALAEWPDSEEVMVRIGAAFAMAGKRVDAIEKLEPYLEKHPTDLDRLYLGLKTVYEARTDGKPIKSKEEDRALFNKWATAYITGKGPQQALVEQWQRAVNK